MSNFKRAKSIEIYDANCNKWEGMKGIVNEANELDRFSIVGEGYTIVQHDEVIEIIEKALDDLAVKHKTSTMELKDGARLRVNLHFPEVVHSIAGETIQLWASYDNSYDGSTGLRLEINAYIPRTDTNLYCSEVVSEKLNRYYHRHTKGIEVASLETTISKGIEIFQNEIGKEFEELLSRPVGLLEAKDFFNDLVENKSVKTAKKYLEKIKEALANNPNISNAWGLYSLVSSILTREVASVDTRRNNARELLSRIKKHFKVSVATASFQSSQVA